MVFPAGAYAAGGIEIVRDFERSSGDRVVQQADKHTGLPLWVVEVIDAQEDRKSTRLNSSHDQISYAVFCLKKKKKKKIKSRREIRTFEYTVQQAEESVSR